MIATPFMARLTTCVAFLAYGPVFADTSAAPSTPPEPQSSTSEHQPAFPTLSDSRSAEVGVASDPGKGEVVEVEVLRQRAQDRWGAMIDRNFYRAYEYCSPAYRAIFSPKQFAARFGSTKLEWESVTVDAIYKESDVAAKVDIKLSAKAFVPDIEQSLPVSTVFSESWVRSEDQWWYVPGN
jgi:hypothetical protein